MGYMPPEYREGNTAATVAADVYSFGILMIEIATQNRPSWPVKLEGKAMGLVEWAREMVGLNREIEMVYEKIPRDGLIEEEVKEYFRIACMCSSEGWKERPAMKELELIIRTRSGDPVVCLLVLLMLNTRPCGGLAAARKIEAPAHRNPNVKTLLSIGGGNSSATATFTFMASQASSRKSFIDSSISLSRSYIFYALDLDWEYPPTPTEMNNLGSLLNE
ncbi:hypothetical protein V6N13_120768 [Hibiscus sabdariffa]|uniref:Protein kinase domain-containing protein n=1 Tax=Hibiscus sabdariffa TaxID=183260 RepID=A0ABR2E5C8_9ROSI